MVHPQKKHLNQYEPLHLLYLKQAIDTACLLENQKAVNRKKEC